jgi:hypothetical protein
VDALPPRQALDEIDAAARDMGIAPGDPAYAFYVGLRRLYADQQVSFERVAEEIRAAQPSITDAQIRQMGNQLIRSFEPTGKRIAAGLTRQAFAWLAGIAVALLFGGAVIGGVGVWYWLEYVPTHYVYVVDQPGQQQHVAPR